MNTDVETYSRLGAVDEVAKAVTTAYRQRSFLGRHPLAAFLVFGISPVLLSILLMPVMFVAAYWIGRGLGCWGPSGVHLGAFGRAALPYGLTLTGIVLPTAVLSLLYYAVAGRIGIGKKWMFASCTALALFAAATHCQVILSDLAGHSSLTVGIGPKSLMQLAQPIVPLAFCWWFVRRPRTEAQLRPTA